MDIATFRADFPEFASVTTYPDASVQFWLTLAPKLISEERWGDVFDQGVELFVAHNLSLGQMALKAAAGGGAPGVTGGLVASKTVDKLSISYDTSAAMLPEAGHWALTTYGLRYLQLVMMFGAGGMQL